jgi:hypothetical protein
MWLLVTAAAAIAATIGAFWGAKGDRYHLGFLSLIYWGATVMWLVNHVIAYVEEGGPFFDLSLQATWVGLTVLLLGLAIWLVRLCASSSRRRPLGS